MTVASPPGAPDDIIWQPTADMREASAFAHYESWLSSERGLAFGDYAAMHRWSVEDPEAFWRTIWDYNQLRGEPEPEVMQDGAPMPATRWLPGVRLNWAEHMLRRGADEEIAVVCVAEDQVIEVSWGELRSRVASVVHILRTWGIGPGDAVVAYAGNRAEVVITLLACASVGALWSSCSPEFGVDGVIGRFAQLRPRVLLAQDGYRFGGREYPRREEAARIAAALPSLDHVIWLDVLAPGVDPPSEIHQSTRWDDVTAGSAGAAPQFTALEASHPLWVLFSSGTTGKPKGIVHSHGGILLEHSKSTSLHNDVRAGDRFMFVASTSWIVWNILVSGLLHGATVILLDASPVHPDPGRLWEIVAQQRVSVLGTGAGYLQACQKAGMRPRDTLDLSALRVVSATGSPLPVASAHWVADALGDVWLVSASGGTDVCGAFVSGIPTMPVRAGRIQATNLGVAAEAFDDAGRPVIGRTGELVITRAMPSMPLRLLGDRDGARYRASYFERFPGVWTHGDYVCFDEDGSCVISGRSDSTLNRRGVRMGSAEIYDAVEPLDSVHEAFVIGAELPDGEYYMPLFLVLSEGADPDRTRGEVVAAIRSALSPRHLPDEIIIAPAVPHTRTGKKLEVPVKRLLQGAALDEVTDLGSVDDPGALDFYLQFARDRSGVTRG